MTKITRQPCTTSLDGEHSYTFDASSGSDKSVFCCVCGDVIIEHEDAGTGA